MQIWPILVVFVAFVGPSYSFHSGYSHFLTIPSIKNLYSIPSKSQSIQMTTSNSDNSLNKKIFCNVELNGQSVEAVGFDMDFTLAQVILYYIFIYLLLLVHLIIIIIIVNFLDSITMNLIYWPSMVPKKSFIVY